MAMVVLCRSCGARFRLDEALLKDAKGARIRCRKCGGYITVRNPAAPPVAPASSVGPQVAPERVEAPKESTPHAPAGPGPRWADLSDRLRPVPSPSPADETDASPAVMPAPAPPGWVGKQISRAEEPSIPPSAAAAGPDPFGDSPLREIGKSGAERKAPSRRSLHARPLHLVAGLSVLLLAGGALYFGAVKPGQKLPGGGSRKGSSMNPVSAVENPVFEIQDVKWSLNQQKTGESLYVIKGTVTNVGKGSSSGIRIEATLLGADNQAILKNDAFAGNLIDETLLPHMSRVRIEGFLGMRYGEGNVNRDIPAGKSLPFMVVFFDPPERIVSFTVKALDAEEQERIRSPVGKGREPQALNQRAIQPN